MKACPFCNRTTAQVEADGELRYVDCKCGARGPSARTPEKAVWYWNIHMGYYHEINDILNDLKSWSAPSSESYRHLVGKLEKMK